MKMTNLLLAATVAISGLTAATAADAAVTINITQLGANVALTASGTFNTALATLIDSPASFGQLVGPSYAFAGFGTQGSVNTYVATGPSSFGPSSTLTNTTGNTGLGIGIYGAFPDFILSTAYVSNSQINSAGFVNNATLASIGLTAGVYNYTVGGNTVTVNIGQAAAVPEPATWGLMILGFGMIGAAARSRKIKTTVAYA
ncbi:PEPxxWA-CTERM sorting domain-containing protein [Sphingomonas sp. Leaf357]|uniref:PEPxxWA-CTERM sorting domain-containing protein n=1 Tax=Sphingomonas sp. Leaf357 TaxID=1736350 RepID=UPI000A8E4D45|nr:PEPxxWA-CTERM sorting domain-containing protein [Sphingomonas sp. Leaf357]